MKQTTSQQRFSSLLLFPCHLHHGVIGSIANDRLATVTLSFTEMQAGQTFAIGVLGHPPAPLPNEPPSTSQWSWFHRLGFPIWNHTSICCISHFMLIQTKHFLRRFLTLQGLSPQSRLTSLFLLSGRRLD